MLACWRVVADVRLLKLSALLFSLTGEGILVMKQPWPSIMRTLYGDHKRFQETYFSAFKVRIGRQAGVVRGIPMTHAALSPAMTLVRAPQGRYFSGDGCRRDEDGYYWITGRVDDVINVSGHRGGFPPRLGNPTGRRRRPRRCA